MGRSNRAVKILAAIILAMTGPAAPGQDPVGFRPQLAAIIERQAEARRQYGLDLEGKATAAAQQPAVDRYLAAVETNTREALELVRANPTDPAAAEALRFVVATARGGPGGNAYEALGLLLDHARDPGMGDFCERIVSFTGSTVAETLIRSVLRDNPNRSDRALACHGLATVCRLRAEMIRSIRAGKRSVADYASRERQRAEVDRYVQDGDPAALDREAATLLGRVVAEFADVKGGGPDGSPLGPSAAGELFALRNLGVGQIAPPIEGKDQDGKPFRLEETRGRVVVLTFSGDWCGPCVAMYPEERDLVRTHRDRPFALVSVSTDADVATLRKAIGDGTITWRCWWDGGTAGPIATGWGISAFPSIFVLDKAGVIRFKGVRGDDLKQAVAALLAEAAPVQP